MNSKWYEQARELFLEALRRPVAERERFLDDACAESPRLREEVASLLRAQAESDDFLETPALGRDLGSLVSDGNADAGDPGEEALPERIGRCLVLRKIGEGGMGVVYAARQEEPRRDVAVKVIRAAHASSAMLRRFEHEIHVLGRLHHPGIAQIFEAGTIPTATGRAPYFVMELVEGPPLTTYAAREELDLYQRLRLMIDVCRAVHYAHQKGVIHRDLKPGNILVNPEGRAKVLDFGVARVTDGKATVMTAAGQIVGTLAYMSPEQLSGDPDEVDTRADVYALGVLCYELIAGVLPHDVSAARLSEAVRVIGEERPRRLATLVSAARGDLETIVHAALEKDPQRRYQSAHDLADDLQRYLADEPIRARPASAIYTLRKFARRNRALVATAGAALLALVVLTIGATWSAVEARTQRDVARSEVERSQAVIDFLRAMLTIDPDRDGRDVTVYELLETASELADVELQTRPRVDAIVRGTIGSSYMALGQYPEAEAGLARALALARESFGEEHPHTARAKVDLGTLMLHQGRAAEAETLFHSALATLRREFGNESRDALLAEDSLASALLGLGRIDEAESLLEVTVARMKQVLGEADEDTLIAMNNLAGLYWRQRRLAETEALLREVVSIEERQGLRTTSTLVHLDNLAHVLAVSGKVAEAEEFNRAALTGFQQLLGPEHPHALLAMRTLSQLLYEQQHVDEAAELAAEVVQLERGSHGDSPRLASALNDLGVFRKAQGRHDDALAALREAAELSERLRGADHRETLAARGNICSLLVEVERFEEAEREYASLLERMRAVLGLEHLDTLVITSRFGEMLLTQGRLDEAAAVQRDTLAAAKRGLPEGQWQTGLFAVRLGAVLARQDRLDEAEEHLRFGHARLEAALGPEHPRTQEATDELAELTATRHDAAVGDRASDPTGTGG